MPATGDPIAMCAVEIRGWGTWPLGIETGDIFRSDLEVGAVCHWTAHTLPPSSTDLRFGSDLPAESEPGLARICCPDPDNSVVFEIRRLETNG